VTASVRRWYGNRVVASRALLRDRLSKTNSAENAGSSEFPARIRTWCVGFNSKFTDGRDGHAR
jgi:hypothetical protein